MLTFYEPFFPFRSKSQKITNLNDIFPKKVKTIFRIFVSGNTSYDVPQKPKSPKTVKNKLQLRNVLEPKI